jgi:hypothetical protein
MFTGDRSWWNFFSDVSTIISYVLALLNNWLCSLRVSVVIIAKLWKQGIDCRMPFYCWHSWVHRNNVYTGTSSVILYLVARKNSLSRLVAWAGKVQNEHLWAVGEGGKPKLPTDRLLSKIHDLDRTAISLGFYCGRQRTGQYFIYLRTHTHVTENLRSPSTARKFKVNTSLP